MAVQDNVALIGLSRLSLVSVTMAHHHRGDDLDDDFMPDETVALSEDEGFASLVGDHDDIGKLLSDDDHKKEQVDTPKEQSDSLSEKKRRRRAKVKERRAKAGLPPHSIPSASYRYPKHGLPVTSPVPDTRQLFFFETEAKA